MRHRNDKVKIIIKIISIIIGVFLFTLLKYDNEQNRHIEIEAKAEEIETDDEVKATNESDITDEFEVKDESEKTDIIQHNNEDQNTQENDTEINQIKIVWFGTSIPSGDDISYPKIVNSILGKSVQIYNEAVGRSCVRAGFWENRSKEDPMGYSGLNADVLLRSMSLSSEEKQNIFENWDYWKYKLKESPATLTVEDKKVYLDCSWDIKLNKYLGDDNRVDYYVFDHGYNDSINYNWNDDSELGIIPDNPYDRTYFIGAMNFLVKKIYEDNPEAKIILIGHYENDRKAGISEAQLKLSDYLDLPIEKTWESTGWTQDKIKTTGYWENGYWVKNGGEKQLMTITQLWMPDDLHPNSDKSGKACEYLARIHAKYLKKVIKIDLN